MITEKHPVLPQHPAERFTREARFTFTPLPTRPALQPHKTVPPVQAPPPKGRIDGFLVLLCLLLGAGFTLIAGLVYSILFTASTPLLP